MGQSLGTGWGDEVQRGMGSESLDACVLHSVACSGPT